jgi:hypothetical protein
MPEPRRSSDETLRRRTEKRLAEPFSRDLPGWQQQLTVLRMRKNSAASTADDRLEAVLALGKLLEDVQATSVLFSSATAGHDLTGALKDTQVSLQRLADQIAHELRST